MEGKSRQALYKSVAIRLRKEEPRTAFHHLLLTTTIQPVGHAQQEPARTDKEKPYPMSPIQAYNDTEKATALTTRLRLNKQRCRMAEVGRGATATHYSMLSTSLASSSSRYVLRLGPNGCKFERSLIAPPSMPVILLKGPCNRRAGV